ncbi:hybrid sensor histidine kinase/response regulator [Leptothoe spongobia]|uniref:histidine kinase n=1 Tax=Leptothoe spongobia TAU-MAC 1115 TaxID=1967444 RepID=A0A947DL45_9CYAN|nr:response regulator [Leptothoe spongobia]MBT9317631.1 response regulator [Leptothoe spongobia TAU-MAC 1115]
MNEQTMPLGTVLVVDDNSHNLSVISECLDANDFEVLIAKSGESALEKVTYARPDIILLDVMMPGISGFETCQQLKRNPKTANIPIIFMTALTDTESKVRAFQLGAADYVTKPFQEAEIIARVKTHLRLHQALKKVQITNNILEEKIHQQTLAEEQLRATLAELKTTQSKLIQAEKLSSLGKMVAGIAHEMNNPLTFIEGNLAPMEEYVQQLAKAIEIYRTNPLIPSEYAQEQLNSLDLDFILKDIPNVLRSMKTGTTRLEAIIQELRNFSHLDQATEKIIDIHEAIDHTLIMVNHRLQASPSRAAIQLHKNYHLPLSQVKCYPQLLNQAIFQLMLNAIDAIDAKVNSAQELSAPEITITTQQQENCLLISISDNGIGIAPENYGHIFDPFFTTKPIGQGVGLGLSNAYQTIQRHHGQLHCQSTLHQGSTFDIILPLKHQG